MMMKDLLTWHRIGQAICLMVMSVSLIACGEKEEWDVEYVPFQESDGGNWGLISPDGDVLFSEEFKEMPSVVLNGRFIVRNADGMWEIYTAEKKPEKVGGEYLSVGLFYDNVAPAVEKGKPIQFINKDGDVKFVFDKVNGKSVTSCSDIINGTAVFKCGDYYGVVSSSGKVLIEPKYAVMAKDPSNRFYCIDKKYVGEPDESKIVWQVLDKDGEELFSMKVSKCKEPEQLSVTNSRFIFGDMLILRTEKDGHHVCGLMKFDGEWMLKPSSKVRDIVDYRKGKFVYYDGTGYGLMDKEGEVIIRAKYDKMEFVTDEILVVKKSGDSEWTLINLDDEEIGNDTYRRVYNVKTNAKYLFAQVGKKDWTLIDLNGKEKKLKTSIENVNDVNYNSLFFSYQNYVSDFVDVDALVNSLNLTAKGPVGLTLNQNPEAVIKAINSNPFFYHASEDVGGYDSRTYEISSSGTLELLPITAIAVFNKNVADIIYESRTSKNIWGNTYEEKKEVGRKFTDAHPLLIEISVLADKKNGRPEGFGELLAKKMIEETKAQGKTVKEGKNAVIVNTGEAYYVTYYDGTKVSINYGKYDVDEIDVSTCDEASVENQTYLNIPFPTENGSDNATEEDDDDWGELESPPAEELMSDYEAPEKKEEKKEVAQKTTSKQKQPSKPVNTTPRTSQTSASSSSTPVTTTKPTQSQSGEKSVSLNDLINYTNKKK